MTAAELAEWEAVARREYLGATREDFRTAQLRATICGLFSSEPINPVDLLPDWWGDREEKPLQTPEAMRIAVMSWNSLLGGTTV